MLSQLWFDVDTFAGKSQTSLYWRNIEATTVAEIEFERLWECCENVLVTSYNNFFV